MIRFNSSVRFDSTSANGSVPAIPEPTGLVVFGAGILIAGAAIRRRRM